MVHGLETLYKLNRPGKEPQPKKGSAGELADRIESTINDLRARDKVSKTEIFDTIEDVIVNFF